MGLRSSTFCCTQKCITNSNDIYVWTEGNPHAVVEQSHKNVPSVSGMISVIVKKVRRIFCTLDTSSVPGLSREITAGTDRECAVRLAPRCVICTSRGFTWFQHERTEITERCGLSCGLLARPTPIPLTLLVWRNLRCLLYETSLFLTVTFVMTSIGVTLNTCCHVNAEVPGHHWAVSVLSL